MSTKNEHKMLETPYTRDRVKGILPAFVMRARLISRPHYVNLRIIAIHCDFSSESYIHIDPQFFLYTYIYVYGQTRLHYPARLRSWVISTSGQV